MFFVVPALRLCHVLTLIFTLIDSNHRPQLIENKRLNFIFLFPRFDRGCFE